MIGPPNLEGQVIAVTGASGTLGRVAATALARAGATVLLVGRTQSRLEATYDALVEAGGPSPLIHLLDFSRAEDREFEVMAEALDQSLGQLNGLFHLAAEFDALRPLCDIQASTWQRSLKVNLSAPILLTRALLPLMKRSGGGQIVFTDDTACTNDTAFWGPYGVAKAGLRQFSGFLNAEMQGFNLRSTCFQPGPVRSPVRLRAFAGESPEALKNPEYLAEAMTDLFCPCTKTTDPKE